MYIAETAEKFIVIVIRIPRYLHVNSRMKPLSKLKWSVETHSTTRNPTLNYLKFFSVATSNRKVARMKGVNHRNYRGQASFACANMATSVFRITTLSTGTEPSCISEARNRSDARYRGTLFTGKQSA